jgi:hypothetical protein
MRRTGGTETSKYPEEKKSTEIPPVAASERGAAQSLNQQVCQWKRLESRAIQGESPVHEDAPAVSSMSRAGHVVSCLNMGGPSSKAKYS